MYAINMNETKKKKWTDVWKKLADYETSYTVLHVITNSDIYGRIRSWSACRWKGSIYKLVWRNLLVYYTLYYMLTILQKFILDEDGQK